MNKTKWVAAYNGDGKHIATVNARGEMRSLGRSNDKGSAVRDEIRAATLAMSWCSQTNSDYYGWVAHHRGLDVPRGGWAGWLEREICTHAEQRNAEVAGLVAEIAHAPPPPDWQAKVNAECDKIDEQTRRDVAASVARHAAMGDLIPVDPDWREKVEAMFAVPQSDPHASFTTQFKAAHADDEPTQVATVVDERFDGSEVEK